MSGPAIHSSCPRAPTFSRKLLCAGLATAATLAIAATPAFATSLVPPGGGGYTGVWNGALVGNVVVTSSFGNFTCNQSSPTGQITGPGSAGAPLAGTLTAIDFENNGSEACTGGANDFGMGGLPWTASFNWASDNIAAASNGTVTLSGVSISAQVGAFDCAYSGNFNATGATTKQVQADVFNADNTVSGKTELRFVNEPFSSTSASPCPSSAGLSAKYELTGEGGVSLQLRDAPPIVPLPVTTPAGGVAGQVTPRKKACKKKKKAAGAAKKCKKKRN